MCEDKVVCFSVVGLCLSIVWCAFLIPPLCRIGRTVTPIVNDDPNAKAAVGFTVLAIVTIVPLFFLFPLFWCCCKDSCALAVVLMVLSIAAALWTVLAVALFDHWFTCTKYAAMLDRECNVAIAFLILALVLGVTVAILTILILCYVKERC